MKRTTLPVYTEGSIFRALIRLAVPIVFANMLQSAYQIVDTFWVGRLSAEAVAAVSLCFPIGFFLIAIGGGLPMAGTILVAQYRGKGDDEAVEHVAGQTLLFIVVIAALMTVLGWFIAEPVLSLIGAAPDVLPDATLYLKFTFLGYIFVLSFFAYQALMRGLGVVQFPMFIVLGTVLLNLVLDPLFIFGWGPVPAMGVSGAALATLCTQAFATVIAFIALAAGRHGIHIRFKELRPDFPFMKQAFFIGLPASIEQSARATTMILMTALVASFGTAVVAGYGIGIRMMVFMIIPAVGLSIATSTLVGQNIGAGKIERAEQSTRAAALLVLAVLVSVAVIAFPFAESITRFFIPEGGVSIQYGAEFLRFILISAGFNGIFLALSGAFRGAGDLRSTMTFAIISNWVILLPTAFILSKFTALGFRGIWWAYLIADALSTMVVLAWYLRGSWKKKELLSSVRLQRNVLEDSVGEEGVVS